MVARGHLICFSYGLPSVPRRHRLRDLQADRGGPLLHSFVRFAQLRVAHSRLSVRGPAATRAPRRRAAAPVALGRVCARGRAGRHATAPAVTLACAAPHPEAFVPQPLRGLAQAFVCAHKYAHAPSSPHLRAVADATLLVHTHLFKALHTHPHNPILIAISRHTLDLNCLWRKCTNFTGL